MCFIHCMFDCLAVCLIIVLMMVHLSVNSIVSFYVCLFLCLFCCWCVSSNMSYVCLSYLNYCREPFACLLNSLFVFVLCIVFVHLMFVLLTCLFNWFAACSLRCLFVLWQGF